VGNYLTFAKAVAVARRVLGDESIRERSFIQAHGTGTPANRRTESHIFNETAKAFGISHWPVAAIKCFLGHTMGVAGGDQVVSTLGVWQHGIIPGITTIDKIAQDVSASNLDISADHNVCYPERLDVAFINAKGFGGNNATAALMAPHVVRRLLQNKHGDKVMRQWQQRVEGTRERSRAYDEAASRGTAETVYRFDHHVRDAEHISLDTAALTIDGYPQPISLDIENPFDIEL
jgi:acetoacetyl-[acyl-carrier protein] synthase